MITILSPSKSQDFESAGPAKCSQPVLLDDSSLLVKELKKYSPKKIGELMSISENLSNLNTDRFKTFKTPFTKKNAKQALFAFTGDVYNGFQLDQYKAKDLDFAQQHLRILSGLYGCLRPLDLIQPYRLEMKTRLKNKRGKNLYEFWGEQITDELNKSFKRQSDKTLINLASNEYFKSVKKPLLDATVIDIAFKEVKDGKSRTLALFAKQARGKMADYIIRNGIDQPEGVKDFNLTGYKFLKKDSTDTLFTFSRKQPLPASSLPRH